jgi:DNA-binding beta-propeller fold protein YncE
MGTAMKYIRIIISIVILFSYIYCQNIKSTSLTQSISTEIKWKSEKIFKTPESVIYDKENKQIYVSNINGGPINKDGNGFISKLSKDGKLIEIDWIKGLNAPKGMTIFNNHLFVTDIDKLIEIDIRSGQVIKSYTSNEAKFLNDVTVDSIGNIFVSDNKANIIFKLKNSKFEPWIKSNKLNSPNGIVVENDNLLIGCAGYLATANIYNKNIVRIIDDTDFIDGLVLLNKELYMVSDFLGAIHIIDRNSSKIKVIDTTEAGIMAADIEYIHSEKLILVPTFYDDRLFAYKLNN